MNKDKFIGKKVILKNVLSIDVENGMITEGYSDVVGILEKIGKNTFFGWDICATVDGNAYKLITLSQIQPIYR